MFRSGWMASPSAGGASSAPPLRGMRGRSTAPPRGTAAERPTWHLAHCQQGVGLQTADRASASAAANGAALPEARPASTSPLPTRIEPVDQGDPMWMQVADAVGAATSKAEDEMDGGGWSWLRPAAEASDARRRARQGVGPRRGAVSRRSTAAASRSTTSRRRSATACRCRRRPADAPSPKGAVRVMTFANGFFVAGADGVIRRRH